jgi:hypothetical protein
LGYFSFLALEAFFAAKMIENERVREIMMMIAVMPFLIALVRGVKFLFSQIISDGSEAA